MCTCSREDWQCYKIKIALVVLAIPILRLIA